MLNATVMGETGANDPEEEVIVPPAGKVNSQMVPLATQGVPPLVTTVVGAIEGEEIHLYFHVTAPRLSVGRLAQELAGFQYPVTFNFTPVTLTTAPPEVTVPPQSFDLIFMVNLSPPGLPCRVREGEKVAVPVTLHPTLPDAGGAVAGTALEPGTTATPTRVKSDTETASNPIAFRTIVTSPLPSAILGRIDAPPKAPATSQCQSPGLLRMVDLDGIGVHRSCVTSSRS